MRWLADKCVNCISGTYSFIRRVTSDIKSTIIFILILVGLFIIILSFTFQFTFGFVINWNPTPFPFRGMPSETEGTQHAHFPLGNF